MNKKNTSDLTKLLLKGGILAGPFYIIIALLQMPFRDGFDPTRHDWSLLANGSFGWIQMANLVIAGLLVVGASIGLRKAWSESKRNGMGIVRCLELYGLGLVGAGIFAADPMQGFPAGTPLGAPVNPTVHGFLHIVTAGIGFLALVIGCFIATRKFAAAGEKGWSRYSLLTGIFFLLGFMGVASSGAQQQGSILQMTTLAFTAAVVVAWSWITLLCAKVLKEA